jgi:hypothetical protein
MITYTSHSLCDRNNQSETYPDSRWQPRIAQNSRWQPRIAQNSRWQFRCLNNRGIILGEIIKSINDIIISCPTTRGSEANVNLITNFIWLGNMYISQDLDFMTRYGIKYIINVTSDVPNKFDFIHYVRFPIHDRDACKINLMEMMDQGADVINEAVSTKQQILIHCKRGHHRSASIIAFYLMKYHNMSLRNAICLIKQIRPTSFRRMTCMMRTLICYDYFRYF